LCRPYGACSFSDEQPMGLRPWLKLFRRSAAGLIKELLHSFQRIDLSRRLVCANPDDAGKPQCIAAGMPVALLNSIERNFNDNDRLHEPETAEVLNGVLLEEFRHLGNLEVRKS